MHFLYALVNFLILGLGLWLVGRRSVLPRFAQRRKDISKALDEAEALEAAALEEQPETETKKEPDALPEEPEDGGLEDFMGTVIEFGSEQFHIWEDVLTFFERLGGQ